MDAAVEYIIRIFIASSVCSVLTAFLSDNSSKGIINIICGIFMTVTIISPLIKIDFYSIINEWKLSNSLEYQSAVENGIKDSQHAQEELINEQVTAYILKKATSLGMSIHIDITTAEESSFIPYSIKIYGDYSPYTRRLLSTYLSNEIGIPEERQQWI